MWLHGIGVRRKRPEKQGCHETVVAETIAPTLNARRSRTNQHADLRFAAHPRGTIISKRAKFGQPVFNSFRVVSYDEIELLIESFIIILRSLPGYTHARLRGGG